MGCDEGLELKVTVVEDDVGQEKAEEGKGKRQSRRLNDVKWGLTREQSKDCSLYFASLIY